MACDKDGYFMNKTNKIRYVIPFILYMGLLIYFLLFAEAFRENAVDGYRYNLIPFREIMRYIQYHKTIGTGRVLLNLLGNIIGFAPFGFFLPCISRRPIDLWAATLFSMEFSITVEVIQLFSRVGCCDVDDVINVFIYDLPAHAAQRRVPQETDGPAARPPDDAIRVARGAVGDRHDDMAAEDRYVSPSPEMISHTSDVSLDPCRRGANRE